LGIPIKVVAEAWNKARGKIDMGSVLGE